MYLFAYEFRQFPENSIAISESVSLDAQTTIRLPVDSFRLASITPWPHDQPVRILLRILWAWPILARWHGLWAHHVPDLAASLGGMRGLLGAGGAQENALAAGIETVRTFDY